MDEPLTVAAPRSGEERAWLTRLWQAEWGGDVMVTRGVVHRLADAQALIAHRGSAPVGAAVYVAGGLAVDCELLGLNATVRGEGTGSALLAAVEETALGRRARRVWLITTNDNLDALHFYQRRGYRLVAVHRGAVDAAREFKPSIPVIGDHGIQVHDEIELEKALGPPSTPGHVRQPQRHQGPLGRSVHAAHSRWRRRGDVQGRHTWVAEAAGRYSRWTAAAAGSMPQAT